MALGRSGKVEVFSLAADTLANFQTRPVNSRHVFISKMPAIAKGLVRMRLDGTDIGTVQEGQRFSACEGDVFRDLSVGSPAIAGVLEVLCSADDIVPFGSGGGSGAGLSVGDLWETDLIYWPPFNNLVHTSVFEAACTPRFGGGTIANVWGANLGAATSNMQVYRSRLAAAFTCGGGAFSARVTQGWAGYPLLQRNGIPAGAPTPPHARCYIWTLPVAWNADLANTDESGIVLQLWDGTAGGWIRAGNNGIGIVRNGVGAWRYVSKRAVGVGTYAESVPLSWPGTVLDYVTVDLVINAATGDRDAVFQLWLNGSVILERSWTAGLLPLFGDSGVPANAGRFFAHVRAGDGAVGGTLLIGPSRFRVGRYNPAGAEVL